MTKRIARRAENSNGSVFVVPASLMLFIKLKTCTP